MGDDLDSYLNNLQEEIYQETKKAFGEKAYERWRNPLFMGIIEDPDGHARVKGQCGDSIEVFLRFENDRVVNASFQTDGCGPSQVCASITVEAAIGKDPDEIMQITGKGILAFLGGLPEDNEHCAWLAVESLHEALDDYMKKSNRQRNS